MTRWVAIALEVAGAVVCVPPALAFRRFVRAFGRDSIPTRYRAGFVPCVSLAFAIFGAVLAACLVVLPLVGR